MNTPGVLNADMATLRIWITSGWRWWRDQLADCLPATWRRPTRGRLTLVHLMRSGAIDGVRGQALAVVLPVGMALCRMIETPIMGERDLASMIALDSRRLMPMGGDGAVIAARVLHRIPETGRMHVELAAISRDDALHIAGAIAAAPRAPVRIYASAPRDGGPEPVDLLPALRRAGWIAGIGQAVTTAWLIVGFAFALNLGVLVWRDTASVDALSAIVDQQGSAVGVAHRIIGRMRAQNQVMTQALAARQTREPLMVMGRVAAALPKGCWLHRFTWTGDTIRIAGFHPHGVDVAGGLRRAGFAVVRYGDSGEAATPLGEPFDATLGLVHPNPGRSAH